MMPRSLLRPALLAALFLATALFVACRPGPAQPSNATTAEGSATAPASVASTGAVLPSNGKPMLVFVDAIG